MRIALAQQNYHIGNFDSNFEKIKSAIASARKLGADIIAFPELAICGYPPRDFLEFDDFICRCEQIIEKIKPETRGIAVIVGSPTRNPNIEGKDLFNSAYFIANGEVLHIAHKALLPTYDIFDEYRYFEPAKSFNTIEYMGWQIAITICEDIWNVGNSNPLYPTCPMDELSKQDPDFMINISASPFDYSHATARINTIKANIDLYKIPIFYVNQVGAQTDLIFDGGSIVANNKGDIIEEMPYFEECLKIFDLEQLINKKQTPAFNNLQTKTKTELVYKALLLGIKDYFAKLGFSRAILGLSGGIDSAVVLTLAAHALGEKNVRAVLMPSQFSSNHSVNDSVQLANTLNCPYDIISIQPAYDAYMQTLAPKFEGTTFNIAEENLQARIRANILMALSNKFGYILLNTSNKSETAVGYGTLYGDMCGGISVIGDLYKTEVYELANFINKNNIIIPNSIINKAPSAELRPNQKDSDSLPEYAVLDAILYQYIELRKGPSEIISQGFDKPLVDKVLRMVNINEFKRYQTPPILRVSPKSFGMGRRLPIVGKYLG